MAPKKRYARSQITRSAILNSARQLFVKKGFSGTSMSDIAKAAEVNQSLIHHHFSTKEKLWNAVRNALNENYLESVQEFILTLSDTQCPKEQVRAMVENRFDFLRKNPDVVRLMTWQSISGKPLALSEKSQRLLDSFLSTLESAQQEGRIRPEIDLKLFTVMIFTSTIGWFEQDFSWLLAENNESPEVVQKQHGVRYKEFLIDVICHGAL